MKRHRRDLEILSDLNLTNMIDTAFTLLIVFILVSPIVKHGIELSLPEASTEPVETDTKTLTIVIDRAEDPSFSDPIYIEDTRVDLDMLQVMVEERRAQNPDMSVVVEADKDSRYNSFAQVLSRLQALNIKDVGLITEPVENEE